MHQHLNEEIRDHYGRLVRNLLPAWKAIRKGDRNS